MHDFFFNEYGLFTYQHLLFTLIGLILCIIGAIVIVKKVKYSQLKIIRITSVVLVTLEILKIVYNIFIRHATLNDYLPFYFCSLTMYAALLAGFTKGKWKQLGESFLFYGSIVSGLCFILYPSSALGIHPLMHVLTFHSLFYHVISVLLGVVVITNNYFVPKHRDILKYLIFTYSFSLIAYLLNISFDLNLMFLNHSFNIPILLKVEQITGKFYPLFMATGENLLTFYLSYSVYIIISKIKPLIKRDKTNKK